MFLFKNATFFLDTQYSQNLLQIRLVFTNDYDFEECIFFVQIFFLNSLFAFFVLRRSVSLSRSHFFGIYVAYRNKCIAAFWRCAHVQLYITNKFNFCLFWIDFGEEGREDIYKRLNTCILLLYLYYYCMSLYTTYIMIKTISIIIFCRPLFEFLSFLFACVLPGCLP